MIRFKTFNIQFEELHQKQSQWTVPDSELQESLRLAVAEVLLPAYRSFIKRFGYALSRYVCNADTYASKYSCRFEETYPSFIVWFLQEKNEVHDQVIIWSENMNICILEFQLEFGYLKTEQNQSELIVWFVIFIVQIFSWSRSFVGDEVPGNVIFCAFL